MSAPRTAVRARGLARWYDDGEAARIVALDHIDLTVEGGHLVGIMGPSGSGKSTLLHLLGSLDTPDAGTIQVAGTDLAGLDEISRSRFRRTTVGFVFQGIHLVPTLSVVENVGLSAIVDDQPSRRWRARADKLLEYVGLSDTAGRPPSTLSGGERQRIALARALHAQPQVLLIDEPTGSLDSASSEKVLTLIRDACAEGEAAGVLVTHDPHAASIADRVLALKDGQIIGHFAGASGNPDTGGTQQERGASRVEQLRTWLATATE